ncbi:MAG: DUF262 domain-containing protein [bacterium]
MEEHEIFKPASKKIKEIFGDAESFYQVPDYQRPYSWEDEQIEQLWEDVYTAYQNNKEDAEIDKNYFLGSIILIPITNQNLFDVVDGQQRITTLTILFCVIRELYPDLNNDADPNINPDVITIEDIKDYISLRGRRNRLKLTTHISKQNEFEQTIINKITWPQSFTKRDKKGKKYLNAALLFKEKCESLQYDDLKEFINYLCNKVRIITITCTTQSFAIKLSQVLNTRGMDLSPADLIKSFLLSKLSEDKYQQFMENWKDIERLSKEIEEPITDLFTFYEYYLLANNPKRGLYEELYELFKNKDSNNVIFDFKNFVELYKEIYSSNNRDIYSLYYLRHQIYWKSILTTAKHLNFDEIIRLATSIKNFYYLYWIAGFTSTKIKQTSFNIIGWLKDKKDIGFIVGELEKKIQADNVINQFKTNIKENVFGESWLKPLLVMIEYNQIDKHNALNYIDIDKAIHIEHILPQENRKIKYWGNLFTKKEADFGLMKIANLTLLSGTKNIQASNRPFNLKLDISPKEEKEKYKDESTGQLIDKRFIYTGKGFDGITGFIMTQKICNEYEKWSKEEFIKRHNWLMLEIGKLLHIDLSDLKLDSFPVFEDKHDDSKDNSEK